jgi:hypothetical protein
MKCGGCTPHDLVRGWTAVALWCVPTILILVGAFVDEARAALWIPSFAIMGVACLVNARGCGRLHCFVTGPLFLLAAVTTALDAYSVIRFDWTWILVGAGVGTLFAYGLEWFRGKYVGVAVP